MSALAEFLLARYAEDEAAATACAAVEDSDHWTADVGHISTVEGLNIGGYPSEDYSNMRAEAAVHIARWDPARVLAKCAADRRIVEFYGGPVGQMYVLQFLALAYADHPDYRPEWKP